MENKKPETSKKTYEVGYKKPPKSHQFKPGQSGNKAGRKKKPISKSLYDAFLIEANSMTEITHSNGKSETVKNMDLMMKATFRDALTKDGPSRKFILEHFLKNDIVSGYNNIVDRQAKAEKPDSEMDYRTKQQLLWKLAEYFAERDAQNSENAE